MKRLNIVTGHYGSGKTEFSINYAMKLKEKFPKVTICDLDIVNPYFRTFDAKSALTDKGIGVIAPDFASTNLDLPTLPGDVISIFQNDDMASVIDVGGDDDGAIALGRYNKYIKDNPYEMFFVINTKRPDTQKVSDILELAQKIQYASRLKITGVVNNANLSYLSSADDFKESFEITSKVASSLGVDVKYISSTPDILKELNCDEKLKFPLKLFMHLPFDALD